MTDPERAKRLLVTGGATGIGAASARLAARRGFAVGVNYRSQRERAEALVSELRAGGAEAVALAGDVSKEDEVERLFRDFERELGPVTALVNSAGVVPAPARVAEARAADLAELVATNVLGTMLCCREAARRMSTRSGGAGGVVVNVSSMAATIGGRPGNSHYAASKAAIDAFSLGFAKEVAREGIRVVSVRPGFTVTELTEARLGDAEFRRTLERTIPLGRPARVEEVAAPILWLLSDEATFVSGATLDVSGGGFTLGS